MPVTPVARAPGEFTTFCTVTPASPPPRPRLAAPPSRRAILRTGVGGAIASLAAAGCSSTGWKGAGLTAASQRAPSARAYSFNRGWLFSGYAEGSADPWYDDSGFAGVTLPHTVTPLSWSEWDPDTWEAVWTYRKHFAVPDTRGARVFVDFDGVMVNATVAINGTVLGTHQGGYLPWSAELTGHLADDDNVLAVIVDSRWLPVPPDGAPGGAWAVDYLQPGGIYRDATLRIVPQMFLSDVFARPVDVLASGRSVRVQATIDSAAARGGPAQVVAELLDGSAVLASASTTVTIGGPGTSTATLSITGIGDVTLWSPDTPRRYTVRVTLSPADGAPHAAEVATGFREAVFRPDGFYLNGERLAIFGLNRHQLFPYIGMAGAARLQRRDAEILKSELNCNMVRCSHYPQSPDFLDACDELGIMVWQEPPGWQYVGDAAWQDLVLENVRDMVVRDRSRPSVILWGTRLNETANYPELYAMARNLAYELDGSRPTTGAMSAYSTEGWAEDVFGFDDYQHSADGDATLEPPLPGLPYLVSEAVGALDGLPHYRWIDSGASLAVQARMHAQVHSIAQSEPGYAGLIGWAGFDYASLHGGKRIWRHMKTPGVMDTFRVPKPGAAVYRSQVDPRVRPVILPVFFWDFGPGTPDGPGGNVMIATNCDRLEIYVGGRHHGTGTPARRDFPGLAHPPAFADLLVDGSGRPELRIDGYLGAQLVASMRMSADTGRDRLVLAADDASIQADGSDTTRLTFRAVDAYGNQRCPVTGLVSLSLTGPAALIGDNPFDFGIYGGVGGAFVRSRPGLAGPVKITAEHPALGRATVRMTVTPPEPGGSYL
jgi:beta-galactosidase